MKNPGSVNADPLNEKLVCTGKDVGYPGGGLFNPMGMVKNAAEEKALRTKARRRFRACTRPVLKCFLLLLLLLLLLKHWTNVECPPLSPPPPPPPAPPSPPSSSFSPHQALDQR